MRSDARGTGLVAGFRHTSRKKAHDRGRSRASLELMRVAAQHVPSASN